jgi:aspartate/methionine/tyrosine aminotransferase
MPGWRLGWMVVPPRFVQAINKLQQNMFINAPTVSQTAALLCWEEPTIQVLETHVTKYRASRELILSRFDTVTGTEANNRPVLKGLTLEQNVAPADGGFYVYVDLGEAHICVETDHKKHLDSVTMCEELLSRYHVAFTPGIDFEDPDCSQRLGNRRFRISYAGGTDNIRTAMDKFTEFWNTYWLVEIAIAKRKLG